MIIIFAPVNKHSYTVPADKLMWAILSRSTSTFYFSINPFLHTVNVVETWNNNKKKLSMVTPVSPSSSLF